MNADDVNLIIQINYDDKQFSIETENLIDLNEIIKQSIKNFNIAIELQKYITLYYKDEDGDINIINNKEDIITSSVYIGGKKYLAKLYLEIILGKYQNDNTKKNEKIPEKINNKDNTEIQRLEEMNNLKDNKISELEKKIMKLEKECQLLNDINKNNLFKIIKGENKLENNKTQVENSSIKSEIQNLINDMFKLERENLDNKFKKLKEDLIININNNIKKDNKNDLLNKISDDISLIKENIQENFDKNKNEKNNINEDYNRFLMNNMAMMKPSKLYKCKNCGCCYMFNECFNISNNKSFKEHNFQLENQENNINKNDKNKNNIDNNENAIIKVNLAEKKEENNINNEINKDAKEKKEKKEEDHRENGDNAEVDNYEEDLRFQEILQKYFFNDKNNLKCFPPSENELNNIKNYYKTLLDKNLDFAEYQSNFIIGVNKEIVKLKDQYSLERAISRKEKIENLLDNFFEEIEREKKRKKNNFKYRKNYFY